MTTGKRLSDHPCYGLIVAVCYGAVSITITLFNKAVFSYYGFKFPLTLFVTQMLISLIFVSGLKLMSPERFGFPNFSLAMARKLFPMALGWWVYGISGVIALKYLNVPMFSAFRRFTTIIVMLGEYRFRGRIPPRNQQLAVVIMSGGAAIAGLTDITFNLPGYLWVTTCAISTALYLLFIDKLGRESGLNDFGLLFYNNILALPFMVASWLLSGELEGVKQFKYLHDVRFQVFFLVSAAQAFLLNFLIFFCTRVNSPLVTSVTGTIKDLVTNALGMTLFGDFPFNTINMMSLVVCFSGSAWYSRLKYVASAPSVKPAAERREVAGLKLMEEGQAQQDKPPSEEGGLKGGTGAGGVPMGLEDLLQPKVASPPVVEAAAPPAPQAEVQLVSKEPPRQDVAGGGRNELLERKLALQRQLEELEAEIGTRPPRSAPGHTD